MVEQLKPRNKDFCRLTILYNVPTKKAEETKRNKWLNHQSEKFVRVTQSIELKTKTQMKFAFISDL